MKLPEGRGLISAALACALCLCWGLGPATAQENSSGGVYVDDSENPARLGPKPKPLRSTYVEPAAAPAEPKPRKTSRTSNAQKAKKATTPPASAVSPAQPARPKLVNEPKPKPKAKRVKQPVPVKQAEQVRPHPQPRPAAVAPAKVSTRAVQQALTRAGYTIPLDGKMNKQTRQALRSFQRAHRLPATGQADRPTLIKLGLL